MDIAALLPALLLAVGLASPSTSDAARKLTRKAAPPVAETALAPAFEAAIVSEPMAADEGIKDAATSPAIAEPELQAGARQIVDALKSVEQLRLHNRNGLAAITLLPEGSSCTAGQYPARTFDARYEVVEGCAQFVERGHALRVVWTRHGTKVYSLDQWQAPVGTDPDFAPLGS
ncbi:hypothetical protein ACFFGH_32630 [Lysobacter korlensis]|uniref:Uncharacterized protein n=1 Tax=Lysobacter korlensis TaxID=553636 RepID=A0ABV6S038_9GAMM